MQEIVDLGAGFYINSDASAAYRPSQWESAALLADAEQIATAILAAS